MKPLYAFALAATLSACATQPMDMVGLGKQASTAARSETCKNVTEQEIAALFDRWNQSLLTGDSKKVVANYADHSILLPTVSNKPRLTAAEKEDYFNHFLKKAHPARSICATSTSVAIRCWMRASIPLPLLKTGRKSAVVILIPIIGMARIG
jgi:hypothetical protein